jgi:hypothetical protein
MQIDQSHSHCPATFRMHDLSHLYKPLDESRQEIRLLRVYPYREPGGIVHCVLETTSLLEAPLYNAVSYVWGDPTETAPVVCNFTAVYITRSLEKALRHMRTKYLVDDETTLMLWVDGLCINQQDLAERSSQVRIMGLIYQRAFVTLAWLGEEHGGSDYAIEVTERVASNDIDALRPETWTSITELFDVEFWHCLHNLFSRPFWTRLWIFQEIALPPGVNLLCGDKELGWDKLERANNLWEHLMWNEWNQFPSRILKLMRRTPFSRIGPFQQARQNRHRDPLLVALNGTLHLCCSDPRDKIYGLLDVSNDDDAPFPDYSKPVRDVYTDFLSRKLRNGRNSVILLLSGSGGLEVSDRTPNLPSWVCDWHAWSQGNYRPVF